MPRALFAALAVALSLVGTARGQETLAFDKPLFLEDKGGAGEVRHLFAIDTAANESATTVSVHFLGADAAALHARLADCFPGGEPDRQRCDAAGVKGELCEAPGVVVVVLEGPGGSWLANLQGGEKTVAKFREDFLRFVRSARVVTRSTDEARQELEATIKANPGDWRARVALANLLLDTDGPLDEVARQERKARKTAPDEPAVAALAAELAWHRDEPDDAWSLANDALKDDETLVRARRVRALVAIGRRQKGIPFPPEFQEDLEKALAAFPKDLQLHDARARERYLRQRWREAIEDFDAILDPAVRKGRDPGILADLLRARAFCHLKIKQDDKCVADCEEAIGLDPKNGHGHRFLGTVRLHENKPDLAKKCFEKAAELLTGEDRNDALILWFESEEKMGQLDEALQHLERFLDEHAESKFAGRAKEAKERVARAKARKAQPSDGDF